MGGHGGRHTTLLSPLADEQLFFSYEQPRKRDERQVGVSGKESPYAYTCTTTRVKWKTYLQESFLHWLVLYERRGSWDE